MGQAVSNLLLNACDAVPAQEGRILLRAAALTDSVEISVQDNGPGIPEAQWTEVFKPYVTSKTKGSGLGLAIVSKIMMVHDGSVELRRVQGYGACFVLTLPLARSNRAELINEG
ncbi:MAG: ATP-binding protein [Acidithiobacillus sp.]